MDVVDVKGTSFMRDIDNMALLNSNKNELDQYRLRKKMLREQKNEINTLKEDMNNLKTDISDIKEMLIRLTQR